LWHATFGGDPQVVGKSIHLDGQPYRVIGVMPKEFSYPHGSDFPEQYQFASLARTDVWVPAALTPAEQAGQELNNFDAAIGRLRGEVGLAQAQSEMSAIEKRLDPLHNEGWRDLAVLLVPFVETAMGPVRPLLNMLMGAVCLVLLMACGNLASLLMARAADRSHELGVRAALGAGRWRLVRLLLTESLLLAMIGGALAVSLSYGLLKVVAKLNPGDIPRFDEIGLDRRVLLFGLAVSIASGVVSGLYPAVCASFVSVGELLSRGGRGMAGVSWRARNTLIVVEIAMTVVLLAGAGLLIRSYLIVAGEDKGFSQTTLTMNILLNPQTQKSDQLRRDLMDRIRATPGVQVAGSIDDLPLSTNEDKGFLELEGYVSRVKQTVSVRETAGEYFQAMQIPLMAGRYLQDSDAADGSVRHPQAVVVSRSFARRYFPDGDPIGHRLRINESPWFSIVGVVGDVRHSSLEETPGPIVYAQNGLADSVAIRTVSAPDAIVSSIRKLVSALGEGAAVTDIQTMNRYVDQAAARRRFQTAALLALAGVAVFLTLVGLYGLLSYTVMQRTAEIGVRMALGASRGAIVRMVALYGLKLTAAGLSLGLCLALAFARFAAGFLYGVSPADLETFIAVPALMLGVAAIACVTPAWKAAGIDPVNALRQQ
jgi:predicted permease